MTKIQKKRGFSILELMIVVAIVSILAAIAIPAFRVFALRARASEAAYQTNSIRTYLISYKSTNDRYLALVKNPPGGVPITYQNWGNPGGNWSRLGFKMEQRIRYQYGVEPGSTNDILTSYKIIAQTDFDCKGAPFDTWELNSDGELFHTDRYK